MADGRGSRPKRCSDPGMQRLGEAGKDRRGRRGQWGLGGQVTLHQIARAGAAFLLSGCRVSGGLAHRTSLLRLGRFSIDLHSMPSATAERNRQEQAEQKGEHGEDVAARAWWQEVDVQAAEQARLLLSSI